MYVSMYINVYIYILYKCTYIVHCIYTLYIIFIYIRIFERDSPLLSKDEPEG